MPNRLSRATEKRIIDLYCNVGWNAKQTAKIVGVSPSTVKVVLKRNGLKSRDPSERQRDTTRLSHKELQRTHFLYVYWRLSDAEVGRILGISQTAVNARLRRMGVQHRSKSEATSIARSRETPEARSERSSRNRRGGKKMAA